MAAMITSRAVLATRTAYIAFTGSPPASAATGTTKT
jgi:hypothetical protein